MTSVPPPPPAPIPPAPTRPTEAEVLEHVKAVNNRHFLYCGPCQAKVVKTLSALWHVEHALVAFRLKQEQMHDEWLAGPFRGHDPLRNFEDDVRQAWYLAAWQQWALSIRFLTRIDFPVILHANEECCEHVRPYNGMKTRAEDLQHYPLESCDRKPCRCRFELDPADVESHLKFAEEIAALKK